MKFEDVFRHTFKALRQQIAPEVKRHVDFILPSIAMVETCRADDFDFFRPAIDAGRLTADNMHHAANRYHLGKTNSGRPIFWMIDETGTPLDAHIGTSGWLSTLLKKREPLLQGWQVEHCLFGQHLLMSDVRWKKEDGRGSRNATLCPPTSPLSPQPSNISVVERMKSAVVLSELYPESLWLATGYPMNLTPEVLKPLDGRRVVLFPPTDESQDTYFAWLEVADQARRLYHLDISVSSILKDHCSPAQKHRCIDLLDFLFDPPPE